MEENKTYVGLELDENNVIKGWCLPADTCEIQANLNISKIICGLSKFVNGKLVNPSDEEIKQYKEHQLKVNEVMGKIETIKAKLKDTDYIAIKHSEGEITDEEYESIKLQRRVWRREINNLENSLK